MDIWILILLAQAFWFIAPAYAANGFAPLVKGKMPIDGGKKWRGKEIFGKGKTIKGTAGGIVFGIIIGCIQIYAQQFIPSAIDGHFLGLTFMTLELVILLSVGALVGDMIGSFIKRRIGLRRGAPAPLLDQLDFLIVAFIFVSFVYSIDVFIIITLIILTPIIHLIANVIGYIAKVKKQPW